MNCIYLSLPITFDYRNKCVFISANLLSESATSVVYKYVLFPIRLVVK